MTNSQLQTVANLSAKERNKQRDNLILLGWCALVLITAPIWIPAGALWMLCTGRTLRSCGEEANRMSGVDE